VRRCDTTLGIMGMNTQPTRPGNMEPLEKVRCALVARMEHGALHLPILPQVANQVIALTRDPNSDAARLATLIHQDQALAGHVLRIANSWTFLPRTPIESLQQAVAWLGINHLAGIAFALSIQNGAFRVQGYEAEITQLWRHALATALYGKEIARVGRRSTESAFLCGLLHTIGKPVILHAIIDLQKELGTSLAWDVIDSLMYGYHTPVGTRIAEKWNLPDQVKEAITYYSNYSKAPSLFSTAAKITYLADRLATSLFDPNTMDDQSVRDGPVVHDLNLSPEALTALLEQGETVLNAADSMTL